MSGNTSRLAEAVARERARFADFVRRRLRRISAMDVEDIVADVTYGLLRRANVSGEVENLLAYAYRALENRIIDFRRGTRDTVALDEAEQQGATAGFLQSPSPTPESDVARLELRERLLWALGSLSAAERAVWIATEIEGRSFRELAEDWEEPLGTLLSRKSRATARLRQLLKDHNPL
ncbi:MAG: RNA polymerase sigma factor [Solidesulfovibrio sp. DCME]|uniref:RNA polymerase sigma factor n=1 Tax=Solidesulfovibrio sp. DCME TaxID=3447380 RepID=UPI003D0E5E01